MEVPVKFDNEGSNIIFNSEMNIFKNKRILVTGGTGMIGIYLINELIKLKPKLYVYL